MKNILTKIIIAVIAIFGASAFITLPTYADNSTICSSDAPQAVKDAAGCGSSATEDEFPTVLVNILNAVIGIAGLIAVVAVVVGGISYITSAGDPGKVKKAKDTVLYAVIGLVVTVFSFVIVNWSISAIRGEQSGSSEGGDSSAEASADDAPGDD